MNLLSTAVVLFVLKAGAAARPIDLFYSLGRHPGPDASYVPCDGRPADSCVPEGSVALHEKALRLEVKVDLGPLRSLDLRKEFGDAVPGGH